MMQLNALASNEHQYIPDEDWVLVANEALIKLVKNKIGEGSKRRYEDLQSLIVPHIQLSLKEDKTPNNRWSSTKDVTKLTPKYLFYSDLYILADKENCKDRVLQVNISKHSDLPILLKNTNYNPSFEYQDTLGTISGDKFEIYTDGTFKPTSLYVSYYKYPKEIDIEGYIKLNGNNSVTQDSDLPDHLEDELVALIVTELGMDTENTNAVIYGQTRSQTNE